MSMTPTSLFLLQAGVIVGLPVVVLRISGLRGVMPLVAVQIFVGLILGPSVFGYLAPDLFHAFAGPQVLAPLMGLAILAVIIFGLISGLHLDESTFNSKDRLFVSVAAANVVIPMTLGCLAGYWILAKYPEEMMPGVTRTEFMAAIGICVSMKALPVLGAILHELELLGHRVAHLALGVAGVNDIVLWILLSILLAARATAPVNHGFELPPLFLIVAAPLYLVGMIFVLRPLLGKLVKDRMSEDEITPRAAVVVGVVTIASALVTELMGLHYIIGAFLVGVIMPASLRHPIAERLQVMTVALMLPFFFALTGMRTQLDVTSPALLEIFVLVTSVSAIGIIGGTAVVAIGAGESRSFGLGLGSLLQAKGLTELIVLTILLDSGIVSNRIFAAMVLMALFSTAVAMPLAKAALGKSARRGPASEPVPTPPVVS
jgi:Kef-type K+ transport system membrane component KefB